MEKIKLRRAVFGEATTFTVEIARDAEVSTLQALIADILSTDEYAVPPRLLALYLARKDEKWLQAGDDLRSLLREEFDEHAFPRIESTWQLNDDDCLGPDFKPGKREIQVLVNEQTAAEATAKRRRVGDATSLADLWSYSQWSEASKLPPPHELAAFLQRPLPFRLALNDATVANDVFADGGPLLVCREMAVLMDLFLVRCSVQPESNTSLRALYDPLLVISTSLCSARGVWFEHHRTAGDDGISWRPDYILQYKGLVVIRGDENPALVSKTKALQQFQAKMRRWNYKLYGDLPYILGYATSGDDLHIFAIEKPTRGSSVEPCQYTTIAELSIVEYKAAALTLFYNLEFLLHRMASTASRDDLDFHSCGLKPFIPDVGDKRTIVLLDSVIERTVRQSQSHGSFNFKRLVEVYKTLKELSSQGRTPSCMTHLQTVEAFHVVDEVGVDNQTLVVELSPIGYKRIPSADEVSAWLRQMLTALTYWHGQEYCHGDVCWRNIVFVGSGSSTTATTANTSGLSGYWMLIDMDESRAPNTTKIYGNHPFHGEKLRFQHDLYQLGELLDKLPFKLPAGVKAMQTILLSAVDVPAITAEMALAKLAALHTNRIA